MLESFMEPAGAIASSQREHLINVTLLTMIAVLPVLVLTPFILFRYRYKRSKSTYRPDWEHSNTLEALLWGIPVLIVVALSALLWENTMKLDPYKPIASDKPATHIQVIGLDWKWVFIYPEQNIASIGEMPFPVDRPITFDLTTDTVMQSFMISALGGQIYAMPGMMTKLNLVADQTGIFEGENTQYNGAGFHQQNFKAEAMTPEKFNGWVETVRKNGIALDESTYSKLAARSTKEEIYKEFGTQDMPQDTLYFKSVTPNLFGKVLMRYHGGQAVTQDAQPGAEIYKGADLPNGHVNMQMPMHDHKSAAELETK